MQLFSSVHTITEAKQSNRQGGARAGASAMDLPGAPCCSAATAEVSMPTAELSIWVVLTRGLGWTGSGRDFSVFSGLPSQASQVSQQLRLQLQLGWVGSTVPKVLYVTVIILNRRKISSVA